VRSRNTFILPILPFVFVAWTAGAACASDTPLSCTTDRAGNWTVTAVGPLTVTCPTGITGDCTAVKYQIVSNLGLLPDHVAILAGHDTEVVVPDSRFVSAPCAGDYVTLLGSRDCSTQAVRMNQNMETEFFDLVVKGTTGLRTSSIVVKKGKLIEECRIASLGGTEGDTNTFNPNAQRTILEELTFKGCTARIPTDPITGEGGMATLSGENCVFVANGTPIGTGELIVNGQSVGILTYGEGAISSGTASCTTKVISNKLYTWCTCARYCSNDSSKQCTADTDCASRTSPGVCSVTADPRPPCP
jgi:hypothetical protein